MKPFVKCAGCGAWIAVAPAREAGESFRPWTATHSEHTFALRDNKGGGRMILAWRDPGRVTPGGRLLTPAYDITLEFAGQINAAAGLRTDITGPLLRFFEDLAALEGDWNEERRLSDADRQFSITCLDCYRGEVRLDVSLAADSQDPAWTVELSLWVPQDGLPEIVANLRRFIASAQQ